MTQLSVYARLFIINIENEAFVVGVAPFEAFSTDRTLHLSTLECN